MPSIKVVAGVAVGTVSRIINNSSSVKAGTRKKMEKSYSSMAVFIIRTRMGKELTGEIICTFYL
ncbi:LacI family DNA-binding transcriptional regulator [Paenibacillus sp. NRS-1782]|uniref:LacI family DNA-binding transcriptional regulator n=1 Tax=unclassified Paenibacillus TaxID=185978 RepID=UPI003D2955E7